MIKDVTPLEQAPSQTMTIFLENLFHLDATFLICFSTTGRRNTLILGIVYAVVFS
jgi:hypothetical protein